MYTFTFLFYFLLLLCVLTSWALDKRKVVKPAPTAALRTHHFQGHEHPSGRETWCVSKSETPPRGGRDAVGRIRRLCVPSLSIFLYVYFYFMYYMRVLLFSLLVLSVVLLKLNKYFFSLLGRPLRETRGEPPPDVLSGEYVTLPSSFIALRRDITTMIFSSFFPYFLFLFAFHSVRFSFHKIRTKH